MAKSRMGGQRDALSNLRNASARLPRPLGGWFSVLAEDAWRLVLGDAYLYLNQRYQSELYGFYSKAINKRYPFNAHSASDVAVSDFREFFKAQGVAERFFETYMRPFVSGDPGSYRLRSVDGYSLPMSKVYLDQMGTAQVIRQSFFAENPAEPQVRFRLSPIPSILASAAPSSVSTVSPWSTATARSCRCRSSGPATPTAAAPAWCWRRWPDDRWESNAIPGPGRCSGCST